MRLLRRRTEAPEERAGAATTAEAPRASGASPAATAPASARPTAPAPRTAPAPGTDERAPARGEGESDSNVRTRRGLRGRTREASAATAGALGSGVLTVARLVMTLAVLVALLIGLAIVLRDVDANAGNTIVKGIHEGANFFASPFTALITFAGHPKRELTVDWGIALLVYLLAGAVLASVIARVGRGGLRYERRHRAVSAH